MILLLSKEQMTACPDCVEDDIVLDLAGEESLVHYAQIERLFYAALGSGQSFLFRGAPKYLKKDGKLYRIPESLSRQQAAASRLSFSVLSPSWKMSFFSRVHSSKFRASFHLNAREREYACRKGPAILAEHAFSFQKTKLAPAFPEKDGKQTPKHGHPVFPAAHATGTCCRSCLEKWHGIAKGQPLLFEQQIYVVQVQMAWILRELSGDAG